LIVHVGQVAADPIRRSQGTSDALMHTIESEPRLGVAGIEVVIPDLNIGSEHLAQQQRGAQ
jgi:hypothetical protein